MTTINHTEQQLWLITGSLSGSLVKIISQNVLIHSHQRTTAILNEFPS